MIELKPAENFREIDRLILESFDDFAASVAALRRGMVVQQSLDDRQRALALAVEHSQCIVSRIGAAVDLIPVEQACSGD